MKIFAFAATAIAMTMGGAFADPIEDRKANMKERGALMRVLAPVAQGKQDFDAATIMDALEKLKVNAEAGRDVAALWPAGTETGDTKSAPSIWADLEGYQAASDKYAVDVAAAVEAKPQDLAAFQAAFGPVAANCGSCHEKFRQ